jgi:hypothetical protein
LAFSTEYLRGRIKSGFDEVDDFLVNLHENFPVQFGICRIQAHYISGYL